MQHNTYIQQLISLNKEFSDRREFHARAAELLPVMAADKSFRDDIIRMNLSDNGYLHRKWTMYEIPFLYVFENEDFYLKIHLFVPLKSREKGIAASAIHHHNNYLLTSYAAFGPGYEAMLFEKNIEIDPVTKKAKLKIRKHISQTDTPLHLVDSWEPHVVINPDSLSATLVLWSPDKKRFTDTLRSNRLLKMIKTPLRKLIYGLKLENNIGIAAKDTFQFYAKNGNFFAIPEDEFFRPTREQSGPEVDDYSMQTVFAFMQRFGFNDKKFLTELKNSKNTPEYYIRWIDMLLEGRPIGDTFAKERINIPDGIMSVGDIEEANRATNS
jgi:hypothetical protein